MKCGCHCEDFSLFKKDLEVPLRRLYEIDDLGQLPPPGGESLK